MAARICGNFICFNTECRHGCEIERAKREMIKQRDRKIAVAQARAADKVVKFKQREKKP